MAFNNVQVDGYVNFVKFGEWNDGTPWCRFSLNHSSYAGKDDSGKAQYKQNYFPVTVKGGLATLAADYLDGDKRRVVVNGYLAYREWNDKDTGDKRTSVEIVATDIVRAESLKSFGTEDAGGSSGSGSTDEPF